MADWLHDSEEEYFRLLRNFQLRTFASDLRDNHRLKIDAYLRNIQNQSTDRRASGNISIKLGGIVTDIDLRNITLDTIQNCFRNIQFERIEAYLLNIQRDSPNIQLNQFEQDLLHIFTESIRRSYHNHTLFKLSLYSLKEQLFIFIENEFTQLTKRLRDADEQRLRNEIIAIIRHWGDVRIGSLRRGLIEDFRKVRIIAQWRSIAKCFTTTFLDDLKRDSFRIEEADLTELLLIIKNCSIFSQPLFDAATAVILNRNHFYGHIPRLLIDKGSLETLNTATVLCESLRLDTRNNLLVETVNKGIKAFVEKLSVHNARDSDFPFWLASATLNLCVAEKNVALKVKLGDVDALASAVRKGFEEVKGSLNNLSEEERDIIKYSQSRFLDIFKGSAK